jgi:hypothetical protein
MAVSGLSIGPMCILVKDHSRALCEQLQQLRLQTGLVDLDIVCEDHHINVHKVVLAACCRFFREQLCKVNVQVPVILRLEDFGLELKRDAVSYIIEFIYRGEVNIPGDRLTDVCQAAHTLGVIGLEHLPVPARQQRPSKLTKDHIQIADETDLIGMDNFQQVVGAAGGGREQNKINMGDILPSQLCVPLLGGSHDDVMILETGEDGAAGGRLNTAGHHNNTNNLMLFNQGIASHNQVDPDIIPLSFSEAGLSLPQDSGPRYTSMSQSGHHPQEKLHLHQDHSAGVADQYRGLVPDMLGGSHDGTFHEVETIDSCLSLFPTSAGHGGGHHSDNLPQDLSPSKVTPHHHQAETQAKMAADDKMGTTTTPTTSCSSTRVSPATTRSTLT